MTQDSKFFAVDAALFWQPHHYDALGLSVWLYLMLLDRAQYGNPLAAGDEEIAEMVGYSVAWVRKHRAILEKHGYIRVIRRDSSPRLIQVETDLSDIQPPGKSEATPL